MAWWLIAGVCLVAAILWWKLPRTAPPPPAPLADVTVAVYGYPDPKDPFATEFVVRNTGTLPLTNITCHFVLKKFKIAAGLEPARDIDEGSPKINELAVKAEYVMHGTNPPFIKKGLPMVYAELEIGLKFHDPTHAGQETNRPFDFYTQRQPDHTLRWYPAVKD
jgi:hypothetical protein